MLRIGIDIGGTFTDFVVYDPEDDKIMTFKLLSDSANPASTVLQGLQKVTTDHSVQLIHGSTVATNALLERKGAPTALVTTSGFKDVLQIARQNRPSLYDWAVKPAPTLVPSDYRLEVDERIDYRGTVIKALDQSQIEGIIAFLKQSEIESVAVCLLFSFLFPSHEQIIVERLRKSGFSVSASCEILPEFREYERTSTTVVNAYVSPILNRYLSKLEIGLPSYRLQIMQSNGGMISLKEARQNGAKCILSGPAGGIVGAQNIVQSIINENLSNFPDTTIKVITFDMGGTSTDVSLIDGQPGLTTDAVVGDCPIHLPMLDIHTIGAGGGSIAYVDPGGSLRVGPQSAGSNPGPACYGRGEFPTVTDANLVLGRLLPDHFLGGDMQIDPDRAFASLSGLGRSLGLTALQTARGVIEVVNAQMEHALRVISVERGYDPRDFALFSFGGAGGLHAVELARHLDIPRVIISKYASTLSAYGMLASDIIKDYVKTVMLPGTVEPNIIDELFAPMILQGEIEIRAEGIQPDHIIIFSSVDARYSGQSYELNVPYTDHFISDFHHAHQMNYGYSYADLSIEIVNLRVRAVGKIEPLHLPRYLVRKDGNHPEPIDSKQVEMSAGQLTLPVFDYDQLQPGFRLTGPALIVSSDTTILINNNDTIYVDAYLNLLINVCHEN